MKQVKSEYKFKKFSKPETISELTTIYDEVSKRLEECANFRPGLDDVQDSAVDALESELQDLQDELINLSAKITLRSPADLKDLLDFWQVVKVQNAMDEFSLSDRMVMNVRDYFDEIALKN
tara:strand:- start:1989 stop:2351 length:363 start_codon:yes stop_codon:yes gene_type:complete